MKTQKPMNQPDQQDDAGRYAPKPISPRETAVITVKVLAIGGGAIAALWWLSQ